MLGRNTLYLYLLVSLPCCRPSRMYKVSRSEKTTRFNQSRKPLKSWLHLCRAAYVLTLKRTLQRNCTENWENIVPEWKLRGVSPILCIHISVSDLYVSTIGLPVWLQQNRCTDPGIYIYVPASFIMYLSDFCRFLLCTCEWERRG
jgi:hypothetical protein